MHCLIRLNACRTAALAAVLLLGVGLVPSPAAAARIGGRTTGAESISSATWGATASTTSMTFTSRRSQYSTVTNSGVVALVAESFLVTVSTSGPPTPTFTILACTSAWAGRRCNGGTGTQIGGTFATGTSTTVSAAFPVAVGGSIYLGVRPAMGGIQATTITVMPEVTAPSQVQAPVKTNQ
jgi:hypothetical protein